MSTYTQVLEALRRPIAEEVQKAGGLKDQPSIVVLGATMEIHCKPRLSDAAEDHILRFLIRALPDWHFTFGWFDAHAARYEVTCLSSDPAWKG